MLRTQNRLSQQNRDSSREGAACIPPAPIPPVCSAMDDPGQWWQRDGTVQAGSVRLRAPAMTRSMHGRGAVPPVLFALLSARQPGLSGCSPRLRPLPPPPPPRIHAAVPQGRRAQGDGAAQHVWAGRAALRHAGQLHAARGPRRAAAGRRHRVGGPRHPAQCVPNDRG